MKTVLLAATMFVLCLTDATGQEKLRTSDPLTNLPLISANEPTQMPAAQICKSKFQGNFYFLSNVKVDAAAAWYSSHLSGFKKVSGYASERSQTVFYNSDRTIVVVVTGDKGAQGENTNVYAVAYERYQPGISEKTINSLTQGKIVCQ